MRHVGIAELKARLSEHIRYVRRGNVLTILDRDTPVAQLVPLEHVAPVVIRKPVAGAPRLRDVHIPRASRARRDPVEILLEDRERGR
ncbi:MAG: type II toxin-antitoxin system Phd/YefM family antitoxin [Gemmatimonadaceae bacterium]